MLAPVADTAGTPDASAAGAPFVLNASETNQTQIFLVPASEASFSSSSSEQSSAFQTSLDEVLVSLQVPVFEPSSASITPFCATFDPDPPAPAPLTAEACDTEPVSESQHKSQLFAYNPMTGALRPMWLNGQDNGTDTGGDASSDSTNQPDAQGAQVDPATPQNALMASVTEINPDSSSSVNADEAAPPDAPLNPSGTSSNSLAASPTASPFSSGGSSASVQDVILVFTAADVELAPQAQVPAPASSPVVDATSTTTAWMTPTPSPPPAKAADVSATPSFQSGPARAVSTSSSLTVPTTSRMGPMAGFSAFLVYLYLMQCTRALHDGSGASLFHRLSRTFWRRKPLIYTRQLERLE